MNLFTSNLSKSLLGTDNSPFPQKPRAELIKDHLRNGQVIPVEVRGIVEDRIQSIFKIVEFIFQHLNLFDRKNLFSQLYPRFYTANDKQLIPLDSDQVDLYGIDLNRIGDKTIVHYTLFMLLVQSQQYQCLYRLVDNYKPYITAEVLSYVNERGESVLSMLDWKLCETQTRLHKNEYFYASLDDFSQIDFLPVDENESHFLVDRANKQFISRTVQLVKDIIDHDDQHTGPNGQFVNPKLPTADQMREEIALQLQFFYHYDTIMMNQYPYHVNSVALDDIKEKNLIYEKTILGKEYINLDGDGNLRKRVNSNNTHNQTDLVLMYTNKDSLYHLCFDAYYRDSVVLNDAKWCGLLVTNEKKTRPDGREIKNILTSHHNSPVSTHHDRLFDSMISVNSNEQPLSFHHHNHNNLQFSTNFSIISAPQSVAMTEIVHTEKFDNKFDKQFETQNGILKRNGDDSCVMKKHLRSSSTAPVKNEEKCQIKNNQNTRAHVFKSFDPFDDMIDPLFPCDDNNGNNFDGKNISPREIAAAVSSTPQRIDNHGVLQQFFTTFLQNLSNGTHHGHYYIQNEKKHANGKDIDQNNTEPVPENQLAQSISQRIPSEIKHTKDLIRYLKTQRFNAYPELKQKQILKIEERIILLEKKINEIHISCENIAKTTMGSAPASMTEYMVILIRKKAKYQAVLQALYQENPWDNQSNYDQNNTQNVDSFDHSFGGNNLMVSTSNTVKSTASNRALLLDIAHEIQSDQNNKSNQNDLACPIGVQDGLSVIDYAQIETDDNQFAGNRFLFDDSGEFGVVDMNLLSPQ